MLASEETLPRTASTTDTASIPQLPLSTRTYPAHALQRFLADLDRLGGKCVTLPIGVIDLSANIRSHIDTTTEEFRVLREQIKQSGGALQHPVVTVVNDDDGERRLVCLAGHRRVLAAKEAGSKKIAVAIRSTQCERERLDISLSENLLREDLHALDIARTLSRLQELGETRAALAKRFGKSPKTVAQYIKMHEEWPPEARDIINANREKFGPSFLLRLARRALSKPEVIEEIKNKLKRPGRRAKDDARKSRLATRLQAYCEREQLSQRDRELIEDALRNLGLL